MRPSPVCVLMSGGLDSGVLLWALLARGLTLKPVYVRCGLRWEDAELYWLRRFLRAIRSPRLKTLAVLNVPMRGVYGPHWSLRGGKIPGARTHDAAVYLPGRNVLLLACAAIYGARVRSSTIAFGILKGNPFGDASPNFVRQMARSLSLALKRPMRIMTPLARRSKSRLILASHGAPLELTFSCLNPSRRLHCGRCNKCAERRRAFRAVGVPDPTRYVR